MSNITSIKYNLKKYINELLKNRKAVLITLVLYTIFCIVSAIVLLATSHHQNALYCILSLLIAIVALFVEYSLKLRIPFVLFVSFLLVPTGALLGNSFDCYTLYPWLDDLLHAISGFLFACFGFSLAQIFIGEVDTTKQFVGGLLIGFVFSLAAGLIWEMFEYAGSVFLGIDMQADSIVNEINSFLLSGSHYETVEINGITQTIIYYENGQNIIIDGYLDLGLNDTLFDMFVCVVGAITYLILLTIGYIKNKKIFKIFCPEILKKEA